MAERSSSHWPYAPVGAPVPVGKWKQCEVSQWKRIPLLVRTDIPLPPLVGELCSGAGAVSSVPVLGDTLRAVGLWATSSGNVAQVDDLASAMNCDWSAIWSGLQKVSLTLPSGPTVTITATPSLVTDMAHLPIFRHGGGVTIGKRARSAIGTAAAAWRAAGHEDLAAELDLIAQKQWRYR